jgi:molybdopterin synthase catalytic subunit
MTACCGVVVDVAHDRLDPAAALDFVSDPAFGGFTMFVGRVRDMNHGRAVAGVSYDVFDALTLVSFEEIARHAEAQFGPALKLYIAHAKGRLAVGDIAVIVAAGTPHRDEAFRACRQVIEAVKHRCPIWKQEHFADGDSEWSEGCSLCEPCDEADAGHLPADHAHAPDAGG